MVYIPSETNAILDKHVDKDDFGLMLTREHWIDNYRLAMKMLFKGVNVDRERDIVINPFFGNYGLNGYVITVNGSPPHSTTFIDIHRQTGVSIWFTARPKYIGMINPYTWGKTGTCVDAYKASVQLINTFGLLEGSSAKIKPYSFYIAGYNARATVQKDALPHQEDLQSFFMYYPDATHVYYAGQIHTRDEVDKLITWERIIQIQPRLEKMYERAKKVDGSDEHFCANHVWYGEYKQEICDLVGWQAKSNNPIIKTSKAYDIAYDKIYAVLPPCKDCNCM